MIPSSSSFFALAARFAEAVAAAFSCAATKAGSLHCLSSASIPARNAGVASSKDVKRYVPRRAKEKGRKGFKPADPLPAIITTTSRD